MKVKIALQKPTALISSILHQIWQNSRVRSGSYNHCQNSSFRVELTPNSTLLSTLQNVRSLLISQKCYRRLQIRQSHWQPAGTNGRNLRLWQKYSSDFDRHLPESQNTPLTKPAGPASKNATTCIRLSTWFRSPIAAPSLVQFGPELRRALVIAQKGVEKLIKSLFN